jgi:hypothetical protein
MKSQKALSRPSSVEYENEFEDEDKRRFLPFCWLSLPLRGPPCAIDAIGL